MRDMDNYYRTVSLMTSSMFGSLFVFLVVIPAMLAAIVIYIILRSRDARNSRHDPQIGIKVALHFLMTVAILLALTGASIVVVDQLITHVASDSYYGYGKDKIFTEPTKTGLAMALAGVLLAGGELWILFTRTNDRKWPTTRRMFNGMRTTLHGLVVTASLTGLFVVAFLDINDQTKENGLLAFTGLLFVWGISIAIHMTLLFLYCKQPNVPGENHFCFECGDDLRGKINESIHHCPTCKTPLPFALKRAVVPTPGEAQRMAQAGAGYPPRQDAVPPAPKPPQTTPPEEQPPTDGPSDSS